MTRGPAGWACALMVSIGLVPPILAGAFAGQDAAPRIESARLFLPTEAVRGFYCAYWSSVDSLDNVRIGRLLGLLAAGRVVGPVGEGAQGDCAGPTAVFEWASRHEVTVRTSVYSDSVGLRMAGPLDSIDWTTMVVPGLRDTLCALLGCRTFAFRGTGAIRRLEFRNWAGAFVAERSDALDTLAMALGTAVPSTPSACPYWNLLRMETERGILFGALAADGDAGLVLAAGSQALEDAWRSGDNKRLHAELLAACTEYSVTRRAYAVFARLAKAHGLPLRMFEEEDALRQNLIR